MFSRSHFFLLKKAKCHEKEGKKVSSGIFPVTYYTANSGWTSERGPYQEATWSRGKVLGREPPQVRKESTSLPSVISDRGVYDVSKEANKRQETVPGSKTNDVQQADGETLKGDEKHLLWFTL